MHLWLLDAWTDLYIHCERYTLCYWEYMNHLHHLEKNACGLGWWPGRLLLVTCYFCTLGSSLQEVQLYLSST